MHEEIAGQAFAVVLETAPAEETDRVERPFQRAIEESVPVNRLFACIRRNGVNPGAAGAVAVPESFDGRDFSQLAGVVDLFGFGVEDRADALAAHLDHALVLLGG